MKKKSPKRYKLVKSYLLKICDRCHHDYFKVNLPYLSIEELHDFLNHEELDLKRFDRSGRLTIERKNDWDMVIEEMGRRNTPELIERDIKVFRAIEKIRSENGLSIEKAILHLISCWPSEIGVHLGDEALKEIHKNYFPIFILKSIEQIDPLVEQGEIEHGTSLLDAAIGALRETMVLTGRYPIEKPTGILDQIHRILGLPFENDILDEIALYQTIRNRAFGITFENFASLKNRSMGRLTDRFEKRSEKIKEAIQYTSEKHNRSFNYLVDMYREYRLIEAEANCQNRQKIYERLQEDLMF
jgi:hypothetical protein